MDLAYTFLEEKTSNFVERTFDCMVADSDPSWITDPCCNTVYVSREGVDEGVKEKGEGVRVFAKLF